MNPLHSRRPRTIALALALAIAMAACAAALVTTVSSDSGPPIRRPTGAFVASGPKRSAVVWAVGDAADGGDAARGVAARIGAGRVDRLLYLGDVYDHGTAQEYREHYAPVLGQLAPRTAPTPGNHEWDNRGEGYEPYWQRVTGRLPPAYYAFRVAGWQLLSLNSEAPHDDGSAQVRWLRARLRRPGTCRLAFWHRPRFSDGKHGDQDDVAPLWAALRGHATLVVSGHDHDMQRLHPIDGLTQLVSGAGGHSEYEISADDRLAFADDSHRGALRIELRPGRARLTFIAADGRTLDDSRLRCRQAPGASA